MMSLPVRLLSLLLGLGHHARPSSDRVLQDLVSSIESRAVLKGVGGWYDFSVRRKFIS